MNGKHPRWLWYAWGGGLVLLSLLVGSTSQAENSAERRTSPPSLLIAQAPDALLIQVQTCVQQALKAHKQTQPQTLPNTQAISTRCMFSVVMLDANGAVRPDASDRMAALVRAIGLKPPMPKSLGQTSVALQQQPGQSLFTVPVTLNDVRFSFILDTGASNTVIDHRIARQLKLVGRPVPSQLLGYLAVGQQSAGQQVQVYSLPPMKVGKAQVSQLSGIGLSTTPFQAQGILGLDFLSRFDVVLNPKARSLSLLSASQPVASGLPLQGKFGVMIMPNVVVNGKGPFRFLVDTGAAMTTISEGLAQQLALPTENSDNLRVAGLGGQTQAKRAQIARLGLQSQQIANLSILVLSSQIFQTLGIEGVIGQDVLNRYVQRWRFGPPGPLGSPEVGSLELMPLGK